MKDSLWNYRVTPEMLVELGFKQYKTDEPFDSDWTFENDNFRIYIDCFGQISLSRKSPDTDGIKVLCEGIDELKSLMDWIAGDE